MSTLLVAARGRRNKRAWPSVALPVRVTCTPIPDVLDGEPANTASTGVWLLVKAAVAFGAVLVLFTLLLPLWLPYLTLVAAFGRPPNVPRRAQIGRYLGKAWSLPAAPSGLTFGRRGWITVLVLRKVATIPLWGIAWLLDELLYARRLDAVELRAPLFEISAGRSGSTQLARYLEDDATLAAPSLIQGFFPYLWMWKLAPRTLGRWLSKERVRHEFERRLPPEFVERHEGDPFRTDTFDAALYVAHLNHLSLFYGADFAVEDFATGRLVPHNRVLWEEDFVAILERIGRKRLVEAGPTLDGSARRLFVKGHFLAAAPALARRFPDARFLTVIRAPEKRLQSAINYLRVNPLDSTLGPPLWSCLVPAVVRSEIDYSDDELAWFTAPTGPRRCVIRFADYVADLQGTMKRIYAECLDGPVPAHVPTEHPPRRRSQYRVDRSLPQLDVDVQALNARLAAYVAWCGG